MSKLKELKNRIKQLSKEQRELKYQRKTTIPAEKRTMDTKQACYRHGSNRHLLRHLFIVYGQLRGKDLDRVEPNRKTEPSQYLLDKLLKKYSTTENAIQ